jgi:hypothetical protein
MSMLNLPSRRLRSPGRTRFLAMIAAMAVVFVGVVNAAPALAAAATPAPYFWTSDTAVKSLVRTGVEGTDRGVYNTPLTYSAGSMAVDSMANAYFIDTRGAGGATNLMKVTPDGIVSAFGKTMYYNANGIAIGPDGYLWVPDSLAGRVDKVAPDGTRSQVIFDNQSVPTDVTVDSTGRVWVATGSDLAVWTGSTRSAMYYDVMPGSFTLTASGSNIYAAGSDGVIRVFDFSGSQVGSISVSSGALGDITADPSGYLYVTVPGTGIVRINPADNTRTTVYSSTSATLAGAAPMVNVGPPTQTSKTPSTTGVTKQAYTPFTFTADGYPSAKFSVTSGALPDGLALNPTTGVLSGTPTKVGTFKFTVTAGLSEKRWIWGWLDRKVRQ